MTGPATSEGVAWRDLGAKIARLPAAEQDTLRVAIDLAARLGSRVAWVGGGVRDLFLGRAHPDLDLVVESDLPPLVRELSAALGGSTVRHDRFGTASIHFDHGRIDLARARRERYPAPGALPVVTPAPLREDLLRRDFSLNAMAIVFPERFGVGAELLDPCGGLDDLRDGRLRVLHSASFDDDPTRILRGVGFELRFGFRLEPETERLARAAIDRGRLERLSGERLWRALRRTLEDPTKVVSLLERLRALSVDRHLLPTDAVAAPAIETARAIGRATRQLAPTPESAQDLFLVAIGLHLDLAEREELCRTLALPSRPRQLLVSAPDRIESACRTLSERPAAHRVADSLERMSPVELAAVETSGGELAVSWVERWRTDLRHRAISLAAADLLAAGVPPGPGIGAGLRAAWRARIDRDVGPDEELAIALAAARETTE